MKPSIKAVKTLLGVAVFLAITAMSCGAAVDLTLSANTTNPTVEQNSTVVLGFSVERQGFNGAVNLSASSTATGITATAEPSTLPEGDTAASVEVVVASTVTTGTYDVTVDADASADGSTATDSLTFTLDVVAEGSGGALVSPEVTSVSCDSSTRTITVVGQNEATFTVYDTNAFANVLATYDETQDADADGQATFGFPGATDSEAAQLDFVTQTSGGVESPAQKFNCSGEVN